MEGARWWKNEFSLTDEDWEGVIRDHPELVDNPATGHYHHGVHIVIFLAHLKGDLLTALVDCWLHEFVEVMFISEVNNHEAFNATVTRIAEHVSPL